MHENEQEIINSWQRNVGAWAQAIAGKEIESRELVTNEAVLDIICQADPRTVLDVGCGEGWLVRALVARGIAATGVDAIAQFIDICRERQQGRFFHMSYAELAAGLLDETFDALVCNFSLLGKDSVDTLIRVVPRLLNNGGRLIIQTLHPDNLSARADGWLDGSWDGFSDRFVEPHPWYFRTQQTWLDLLGQAGFDRINVREPCDSLSGKRVSIIFTAAQLAVV